VLVVPLEDMLILAIGARILEFVFIAF